MNADEMAMNEPQVILPLVHRHVEDAAFYWMQLEDAANNPRMSASTQLRFEELLDAHLEGLAIAGAAATPIVVAALDRWRSSSEVFVAAWHALLGGDHALLSRVMELVARQPRDHLRALISALAMLPAERARDWMGQWPAPDSAAEWQVAVLRAIAATGAPLPSIEDGSSLMSCLRSPHAGVRAAACRLSGTAELPNLNERLGDADLAVRAEAALALCRLGDHASGLTALWPCVAEQARLHAQASAERSPQEQRRLDRWLGWMAQWVPVGHADIAQLLQYLPPRAGLTFALHHGDPALLPWVAAQLNNAHAARLAGWVWACLTGIDLPGHQLVREVEAACDEPLEAQRDAERGLPLPDLQAIASIPVNGLPLGQRCLLGRALDPRFALDVLASDACAPVRRVAAGWLASQGLAVPSKRWPLHLQLEWVGTVQAQAAEVTALEATALRASAMTEAT
jgi:uncharacterized protein (TIGR02270 family)